MITIYRVWLLFGLAALILSASFSQQEATNLTSPPAAAEQQFNETEVRRLSYEWERKFYDMIGSEKHFSEMECNSLETKQSETICWLFVNYNMKHHNSFCSLDRLYNLYRLRQILDSGLGFNWAQNKKKNGELFLGKFYLHQANEMGQHCSKLANELLIAGHKNTSTLLDQMQTNLIRDVNQGCKNVPRNELAKRPEVRSLECFIERLRNQSFQMKQSGNIMRLLKFMRQVKMLDSSPGEGTVEVFNREIVGECIWLTRRFEPLFALYKTIPLRDEYFVDVNLDEQPNFFNYAKVLSLCDAIGENSSIIREKIGTMKLNLLSRLF